MALARLRRRADRALRERGWASGILMYHRVAAEPMDPWRLCVSPETFDAQLAYTTRVADCVPLQELVSNRHNRAQRPRLALTFDDGYRDNLLAALPVLERHGVPATIFVVPDQLGQTREFWWDALERCVLRSAPVPAELTLDLGGVKRSFRIREAEAAVPSPAFVADAEPPRTQRQRLFLELWGALVALEPMAREAAVDALMAWSGTPLAAPQRLAMTSDELVRLAAHPLIEIGGHTGGHRSLPRLSLSRQHEEIARGRRELEAIVGRPVTTFSYPFGHSTGATRALVWKLGFELACTSQPGAISPLSWPWALPRMQVVDEPIDRYAEGLRRHMPQFDRGAVHA